MDYAKAGGSLRVTHLIEGLGPGGAERLLYTNLKHLDPARVESTVLTLFSHGDHWKEPLRALGVRVESLQCSGIRELPRGIARLRTWLRREQPDLLHTHLWGANVVGRIAGRLSGVPVISSVHNPDYEPEAWSDGSKANTGKRRLIRALDRWSARFGCQRMIAVSEYVRQSAHRHLRFPLKSIELLYNPIDADEFQSPPARGRAELLREAGIPAESMVLLNVGRISPQKGLLYAVHALPEILIQHPNVHLVSLGAADDAFWRSRLEDEIRSANVVKHVHLLGARRDVRDWLRACDLFVFPSLHEGLGIALIEAMAAGCACVATSTGPLPEVVSHEVDGWLIPPRDATSLAQVVCMLLKKPQQREKLGVAAKKSALARFQPQLAANKLMEIYESMSIARTHLHLESC